MYFQLYGVLKAKLWRDEKCHVFIVVYYLNLLNFTPPGDLKSEETANKEAGEEKAEEDNDYHRSDEQVGFPVPI